MGFPNHEDYDRAMDEILADTDFVLDPDEEQSQPDQAYDSCIGYKLRRDSRPLLRVHIVFYPTAYDFIGGHEQLTKDAKGHAQRQLDALDGVAPCLQRIEVR